MATEPLELTVAIGESAFAVADRVPWLIDASLLSDNQSMMIDHPLRLTVQVESQLFRLPTSRFVSIDQVAGVVIGVGLAPMMNYGDLETCRELAIRLIDEAQANGWTLTERHAMDLSAMAAEVAMPGRRRYNMTLARLRRGVVELRVYIKEVSGIGLAERDTPARGSLFLTNTDFRAHALDDQQNALLFERRRQLTGGVQSVPLTVWRHPR